MRESHACINMKINSPLEGWLKYEVMFELQGKLQNNKERLPRHIHVDEYYVSTGLCHIGP